MSQFDPYAETYEQEVNRSLAFLPAKHDYFTKVKAGYLVDLLDQHFEDTRRVHLLDVGCGTGGFHPLVADRLGSVTGVDVSAKCLATAAQRNPQVNYHHYDGTRLPFDDARFHAVTAICVMHHVPPAQWPAFAAELRRVVKPGGLAVIFEHNPRNLLTSRVVSSCEFDADAVLLRLKQTHDLLAGAGFTRVASRTILSIPSFGRASRQVDLLLGRLGLGAQYFVQGAA
jgi:ubiquinone/menaquinone biosynthesis C-methylase UbiE